MTDRSSGLDSRRIVVADEDSGTPSTHMVDTIPNLCPRVFPPQHEHATPNSTKQPVIKNKDESAFVNTIGSRTPAETTTCGIHSKAQDLAGSEEPPHQQGSSNQDQGLKDDSFVGKITTRSPAKIVTRIEDSVEAIDAFEEEIEKIGELIPTLSDTVSPVKTPNLKGNVAQNGRPKPKYTRAASPNSKVASQSKGEHSTNPSEASAKVKDDGKHTIPKKVPIRVSAIHKAPFQPTKSNKPPTRSNFELPGEAVAKKLKEQREERLKNEGEGGKHGVEAQPAPKVAKSTRPLTQSTFALPGDAVARKLKEQREKRLKQQEADAKTTQREFKARPIRLSQPPVVRENTTSKARMSLAKQPAKSNHLQDPAPTIRAAKKRQASFVTANNDKRLSTLSVAKRTHHVVTGTSTWITRDPCLAATASTRLSASAASQRVTSAGKSAHQTARGREVFERNRVVTEELERLRKEKEEAAKKARAEAAERGRMASRQWAEKQKARKISADKGKDQKAATAAR